MLNVLGPPDIQATPIDIDLDGVVDQYNISMRIKKPVDDWRLRKMDLIIAFDYKLKDIIKLKMEGLAIVSVDTMASAKLNPSEIRTRGQMELIQPIALKSLPNGVYKTVYDDNYFDHLEHMNMINFLAEYMTERNETLHYDYRHTVSYGPLDQSYVDINMIFEVPAQQEVTYVPRMWQVLKMAWVQFFTLFLVFYVLLYQLYLNFVVTGGVFDTIVKSELNLEQCR